MNSKDCVASQGWHSADNVMALPAFCVTTEKEVEQGIFKEREDEQAAGKKSILRKPDEKQQRTYS